MADEKDSGGAEWMQKLWRPAMGWMYMLICLLDMAIFPILWSLLQAMMHMPITQWNPLTLQGAGLFHIAMGAVLGISAFGRTQEKLAGTAANPTSTTQTVNNNMSGNVAGGFGSNQGGMGGGFGSGNTTAPATGFAGGSTAFGAPSTGGFGATSGGFGSGSTGGFGNGGAGTSATGFAGGAPAFGSPTAGGFGASGGGFGSAPAPATSGFGGGGFGSTPPATTASGKKIVPDFGQPAI